MTTSRPVPAQRTAHSGTDPASGLHVVETFAGRVYLGELSFTDTDVTVYTGYVGRPPVLQRDTISEITPAEKHPDVTFTR
jgi:hypothetical protein